MLKWRLFAAFSSIIVFVAGILIGTIYFVVYHQVMENTQTNYDMIFDQYSSNLSGVVEACKSDILSLCIDDTLQDLLEEYPRIETSDQLGNAIDRFMKMDSPHPNNHRGYLFSTGVPIGRMRYNIVVYARNSEGLFQQLTDSYENPAFTVLTPEYLATLELAESKRGSFLTRLYSGGSTPHISVYKAVYDTDTFEQVIGVLCCEIPLEDIRAHFFSVLNGKYDISICLIDPHTTERSFYGLPHYELVDACVLNGTRTYTASGYFVMEHSVSRRDFYLIGIVSMSSANQLVLTSLTIVLISALLALSFSFLYSLLYASYITKPIKQLSDTMKKSEYDKEPLDLPTTNVAEIRELYISFNAMVETINNLIYVNYVTEINKKQSELNALQSQINTHFLYNTLDTVNWLALDYGAHNISLLVQSLSSLLRVSLNNGQEYLHLRSELEHVRSYIEIQNIRYDGAFAVEYIVDPAALDAMVPKMLLQPLVENAIYHGFAPEDNNNLIIIEVRIEQGFVHEIVKNSGTAIDLEKVNALLSPSADINVGMHYGVKNIAQRLRLNYGDNASYAYSIENGFTVAHIMIPYAGN